MTSPEWLIERGIGETRLARVAGNRIIEARILVDGLVAAGSRLRARLVRAGRAALALAEGEEYLLPGGAAGTSEGGELLIEVTRERIAGGEPWKRPLARPAEGEPGPAPLPPGRTLTLSAPDDPLEQAGWSDLIEEARSGVIRFAGGELRVSLTPAMTLIDVDGTLPLADLALAGAAAATQAIQRHGLGGSIVIDLPTVGDRTVRKAIGESVDQLLEKPFERTAVNGFGLLQIVRPRRGASLFELAADRAGFEARALLRGAGRLTGPVRITAHPAVIAAISANPQWLGQLERQCGGAARLHAEPGIAMSGGHAQQL